MKEERKVHVDRIKLYELTMSTIRTIISVVILLTTCS